MNSKPISKESSQTKSRYHLYAKAARLGLDEECIGYELTLKKDKKVIFQAGPNNFVDLSTLVIKILQERAIPPVSLKTQGSFYEEGDKLIREIVNLYNSHRPRQ